MNPVYTDLSHTIFNGLVTYKGLPAPVVCDYLSREDSKKFYVEGTQFQIGKIEMVANTGTYIDCPFHRYEDGEDLSEVSLESFVDIDGVYVEARGVNEVGPQHFHNLDVKGKAVLICTGWAKHWNTPSYFENHPFVTAQAAEYLRDHGARLVGIDSHNIDDTRTRSRPVHSTLLRADILIVEHLCNLESLPPGDFLFSAVPPKFKGVGTFPVRAFVRKSAAT
jgi:kynurenine formamidase